MRTIHRVIATAILTIALLASCGGGGGDSSPREDPARGADPRLDNPATKSGLYIEWSPGMPERPTLVEGVGWAFDFPTTPNHHMHYLAWYRDFPRLTPGATLRARFRVEGGGFIAQEYPENPATVSLLIQRRGDDWSAAGPMNHYRWFSGPVQVLEAGEFELSVPLVYDAGVSIMSAAEPEPFAALLADPSNIAVVFGSDGGRGHGVYATEPSRFTLLSITVEPPP